MQKKNNGSIDRSQHTLSTQTPGGLKFGHGRVTGRSLKHGVGHARTHALQGWMDGSIELKPESLDTHRMQGPPPRRVIMGGRWPRPPGALQQQLLLLLLALVLLALLPPPPAATAWVLVRPQLQQPQQRKQQRQHRGGRDHLTTAMSAQGGECLAGTFLGGKIWLDRFIDRSIHPSIRRRRGRMQQNK